MDGFGASAVFLFSLFSPQPPIMKPFVRYCKKIEEGMTDPHPTDPLAYQEWVNELEQKWQAGLIPDPQAVAIIVLNDRGEVLLQLRDNNPNISFANSWTLPGGVVEANETTEETGLSLDLSHWKVYKRESKIRRFIIEQHIYTGKTQQEVSEMVLGEGQALHFFKQEQLLTLSIAHDFDKLLHEFFEHSKGRANNACAQIPKSASRAHTARQ